jgi:D-alanyl-lipoteichoic acid acyltransferase DltB (MBOAT superfamily)
MYFNSLHFVAFFVVVLGLAGLLRKRVCARNVFLLIASYYFYACWDWRFLSLILISTLVDYFCGLAMNAQQVDPDRPPPRTRRRKLILLASLVTNLGLLGFFKYFDFFATSAARLLTNLGLRADAATLDIILPVGISFYTFQTLSYTIDVYRGKITTERNLLNFAVFVAFFPQLVAGPIERASHLLPQMSRPSRITWERLCTGFYLICWGMIKKVVLADNIARVVDTMFARASPSGFETLVGAYAFAIQIYCDFSGYSSIARGTARCLGFDLMRNFNLPYFATNPSDFWRRWHISLSTWLRDYLYIPLGGNRRGKGRAYLNLMLTMTLGGLWHGAAWRYVVWGVYHGLLLCAHRAVQPWLARHVAPRSTLGRRAWFVVRVFFHLVCLGFLIFRAPTLARAWLMCANVVRRFGFSWQYAVYIWQLLAIAGAVAMSLLVMQIVQYVKKDDLVVLRLPVPVRALVYAGAFLSFLMLGEYAGDAFIYFAF